MGIRRTRFFVFFLFGTARIIDAASTREECTVTSECEVCLSSDRTKIPECNPTGKIEYTTCSVYEGGTLKFLQKVRVVYDK